jgi:hypothetical protein
MQHGLLQADLSATCSGQAGKAAAGAKGIHTSNRLNKMTVNFFTIEFILAGTMPIATIFLRVFSVLDFLHISVWVCQKTRLATCTAQFNFLIDILGCINKLESNGAPISPSFSPDTTQVFNGYGVGFLFEATEFVLSARTANGVASEAANKAITAKNFSFFIFISLITD